LLLEHDVESGQIQTYNKSWESILCPIIQVELENTLLLLPLSPCQLHASDAHRSRCKTKISNCSELKVCPINFEVLMKGPNIFLLVPFWICACPCYVKFLCGLFQVSNLIMVKPTKGLQFYQEFILQDCYLVLPDTVSCFLSTMLSPKIPLNKVELFSYVET
jgi:hypothetical protein